MEFNSDKTLENLVKDIKESCREKGEILIEIEIEGNSLTQSEWEKLAEEKIKDKNIELRSEPAEYISEEIVHRAKKYLDDLSNWIDNLEEINDEIIEDLKKIPKSLMWLNLAIEQVSIVQRKEDTLGGKKIYNLLNQNDKFISEFKDALSEPQENRQLIESLVFSKLPQYLENYRFFYESLEKETRRIT